MVITRSGLLGVSDLSPDLRDLLAQEYQDVRTAEAVALFYYQAKKYWSFCYLSAARMHPHQPPTSGVAYYRWQGSSVYVL